MAGCRRFAAALTYEEPTMSRAFDRLHCCGPIAFFAVVFILISTASRAKACPFCTAQALTLTEEIKAADVAVIARSLDTPKPAEPSSDEKDELERVGFEVLKVIKWEKHIAGQKVIKALYFGQA